MADVSILDDAFDTEVSKELYRRTKEKFLAKIEAYKVVATGSLDLKKQIFLMTKAYNALRPRHDPPKYTGTRIILTGISFSTKGRNFFQNKYFLVVKGPTVVQGSNFVTSVSEFVSFNDVFVFNDCPHDFFIEIELYAVKVKTQLWNVIKKVFHKESDHEKDLEVRSISDVLPETGCFQFLERYIVTRPDMSMRPKNYRIFFDQVVQADNDNNNILCTLNI